MKRISALFILCLSLTVPAEVRWGSLPSSGDAQPEFRNLFTYSDYTLRGAPLKADLIEIPAGVSDPFGALLKSAKPVFRTATTLGIEKEGRIILYKRISAASIFRLSMSHAEYQKVFEAQ